MHCKLDKDLLPELLQAVESDGCSGPVLVIVPLVVVPGSFDVFSELFGDATLRLNALDVLRITILRFKSSLNKLFNGDTFIKELKLLDVADCN